MCTCTRWCTHEAPALRRREGDGARATATRAPTGGRGGLVVLQAVLEPLGALAEARSLGRPRGPAARRRRRVALRSTGRRGGHLAPLVRPGGACSLFPVANPCSPERGFVCSRRQRVASARKQVDPRGLPGAKSCSREAARAIPCQRLARSVPHPSLSFILFLLAGRQHVNVVVLVVGR